MTEAASKPNGLLFRLLTLAALALMAVYFFFPAWWVALKAPNYPEHSFPDGVRIEFHLDSMRNGCKIRASEEVAITEALDCVHEMDTINHFVGMFPIASGAPVEKTFSPFLVSMLGVMLLGFMAPGRRWRLIVTGLGFVAVAGWMSVTMFTDNGVQYLSKGYLNGLVVSLGQSDTDVIGDENLAPVVRLLQESLARSEAAQQEKAIGSTKSTMIGALKAAYERDEARKPEGERTEWTGNAMQVFAWHYGKSLGRWFNNPEENGKLVSLMVTVANLLFWVMLAAMVFLVFAARTVRLPFYWLLVLAPMIMPVAFLIEYGSWLWWYGHSLNELGAFTLKPFMPTVFGDGKVAQFSTHSYPALGFGAMVLSSLLLALAALLRRKQLRSLDVALRDRA